MLTGENWKEFCASERARAVRSLMKKWKIQERFDEAFFLRLVQRLEAGALGSRRNEKKPEETWS